jgi:2-methylisocitrate lyase-like PEP mutase family enzyme
VAAGFPVVATSSAALNAALGHADDGSAPADEVFAAIARIAGAVDVPVTADIEDGYGLAPEELVAALLAAGAAGCNLEDTDHARGALADPERQAERIAAVKAAGREQGVDLVLNARIDAFLLGEGADEALRRVPLYLEAGADCVYPITIPEPEISRFVTATAGRLNVLAHVDDPALQRLAALGVARVSFGSRLAQTVNAFLAATLAQLREEH